MSTTHACAVNAAVPRADRNPFRKSRVSAVLAVAFLLSGCMTGDRLPLARNDPSDPSAPSPRVTYRSTTASHVSQRPVAPGPWRGQNERAAPQPKSEQ